MKIVLIGIGLLGSEFNQLLKSSQHDYFAFDYPAIDITDYKKIESVLNSLGKIDVLINCAAYTQVDQAEIEKALAYRLNVEGVKNLALYCKKNDVTLVHFSTDYIFDGQKEMPYLETDQPDPINYYGYTKLESEKIVESLLTKYYIFRVQWLYGKNGPNFVYKIIELAKTKKELEIVADQWGTPTWAKEIAEHVLVIIENKAAFGIYNFSGFGVTTWYEFAKFFTKFLQLDVKIKPVTSDKFKTLAKRPRNSRLNIQKFLELNLKTPMYWDNAVKKFLT
ncbi:MAG: dTDP-4-dehydrorhamnose reductase [Candidatus Margulisiibacteriota bacterium]|jgi:dTDP-4-dehydrorhamnose reductase